MEILPLALFLVMLELTVGSFVSLYLLDLRGDSSRNFVVFQGVLYAVFALLTVLAMNAFAAPEIVHGFGLDESWLRAQGPLVVSFSLLMIPWNVLLWGDKQARGKKGSAKDEVADAAQRAVPTRRWVRFVAGGLTSLVGVAALFDVGMAYRTLANSHLGGMFVVLTFVAGGMALGGVMTAMLLGHWYLNTPTASGKPLEFVTAFLLVALVAELGCTLLIGPNTAHVAASRTTQAATATVTTSTQPTATTATTQPGKQNDNSGQIASQVTHQAPLGAGAMVWLQYLMGFIAPLILGGIALYLTRGRSFQSATGMLYLCVSFIFIGEVIGRGLLLLAVF